MIYVYATGILALLILISLTLAGETDTERDVGSFTLGPAWTLADSPRGHRAAPAPDRDWVIA
jgi:hypothetical protein